MMIARSKNCNGNNEPPLPRTKYLEHSLYLTLEEMFSGTTRRLAVNANKVCDVCQGSGSAIEIAELLDTCEECNGLGVCLVIRKISHDMEEHIERDCELCWGKGEAVISENRCLNCLGRKTVPDKFVLKVRVKPGSRHGQKIIYKGDGNQEPNMRPGDVIVILHAIDHPIFKRQGDDLLLTVPLDLNLVESLCGFEKIVSTLDKRRLRIRSPPGNVVRNNEIQYVGGAGMPIYLNPRKKGRLFIRFEVNLPDSIRARHANLLEQCLPPRPQTNIPTDAVECNLVDVDMLPADDHDQDHSVYEPADDDYNPDQNYEPQGQYKYDQYDEQDSYHQHDYDQQYYHGQQYDECESLESYDGTQQH